MKNNLHFWASKRLLKSLFPVILLIFLLNLNNAQAQVNFTQTTDADFNRGVVNGTVVSGDNVFLQNSASDVGNWLTTTVLPQSLSGHKTVTWNNRFVYLVGGYNNSTYSSSVYYSGINSGGVSGWTTLTSLPVGLKDAAVVIGTNTIYVLGGRNATQGSIPFIMQPLTTTVHSAPGKLRQLLFQQPYGGIPPLTLMAISM